MPTRVTAGRLAPAIVAACLLAGCNAMPVGLHRALPPASPALHAADRRLVPADLVFTMEDGARLPARLWRARGPERAVVLALHGFDDSRDAWEWPAPAWAARGITLYAPDQRGFGQAPGRGRWAGTERMVQDAAELARQVAAREPGVPLYLMGESMGGAVLLCLAARPDAPKVAGTILLAPAVWGSAQMNALLTASLWTAATVAPGWNVTGRHLPIRIAASDNRAALYRLAYDPLTLHATRADALQGLVALMGQAQDAAARARGAILVAYGGRDQLVPPRATAATWARMPATARRAFYPAGYHLLLRDLTRDAPTGDVASWILSPGQPLPSGADVAAAGWVSGAGWEDPVPALLPASLLDDLPSAP